MPPIVIDIRKAEDARDVVHRAVQALAEGQLIALPTETVYGLAASACRADAVERLLKVKGRPEKQPLTLAITGPGQISLDALLGTERAGLAWGIAAAALGTLGAGAQLLSRRTTQAAPASHAA